MNQIFGCDGLPVSEQNAPVRAGFRYILRGHDVLCAMYNNLTKSVQSTNGWIMQENYVPYTVK